MKHSNSKSWKSINFVKHLLTYSASSLYNPKKSFKVESWTFFIVVPSFFIQNQFEFQKLNSHRSSICVAFEGEILDWLDFRHCMSFITLDTLKLSNLKYCSMQIESYCSWAQSKKGRQNALFSRKVEKDFASWHTDTFVVKIFSAFCKYVKKFFFIMIDHIQCLMFCQKLFSLYSINQFL